MGFHGYIRVSTETQAEKGYGLEAQRASIEAYCSAQGISLAAPIHEDAGISGAVNDAADDDALSKRVGLIEMLGSLSQGDAVIVLNTSRLWRSDTAKVLIRRELMRRSCRIISIEQPKYDLYAKDPNDRFISGIMELLDEWERLSIALKLARGRTTKAGQGDKPAGVCPFGYRYTVDRKHIEIDQDDAGIVRRIFSAAQTGSSLRDIACMLNGENILTRQGKSWSAASLGIILRNDFYTGILTHAGRKIDGNHTAIISKVQFGKVNVQLNKRRKNTV